MNPLQSFGNNAPERRRQLSSKEAELLRAYYATVNESFSLLHQMGFASDPELIRAAMGLNGKALQGNVVEFPAQSVQQEAETVAVEQPIVPQQEATILTFEQRAQSAVDQAYAEREEENRRETAA